MTDGGFDAIAIDHVYASKAKRLPHLYPFPNSYVYPLIWIQKDSYVRNLSIRALYRREENVPAATLYVGANTVVEHLILSDICVENRTGEEMPFFVNLGTVRTLSQENVRTEEP